MYDNEAKMVAVESGGLGVRETIAQRLDRQIDQVSTRLQDLKDARKLIADNPILEQFHNALTKVGY